MPLDPQTQAVLDYLEASGMPPMNTQTVADARGVMLAMGAMRGELEPVGNVEDREVPGPEGQISVRIYTPEGKGPFSGARLLSRWWLGHRQYRKPRCCLPFVNKSGWLHNRLG